MPSREKSRHAHPPLLLLHLFLLRLLQSGGGVVERAHQEERERERENSFLVDIFLTLSQSLFKEEFFLYFAAVPNLIANTPPLW